MADMNLAEFLEARYDEDEAYIRTVFDIVKRQEIKAAEMSDSELAKMMPAVMDLLAAEPAIPELSQQWAARGTRPPNDLNRVLSEVEAKRKILADHEPVRHEGRMMCATCLGGYTFWPCPTLLTLAAVWRDHPDYNPSWRPEP
jgi:hypothetical protein